MSDDIPKKNPFRVPEDYFEQLPGKIQSRLVSPQRSERFPRAMRLAVAYALPLLLVAAWLWFTPQHINSAESLLATVKTEELVRYLDESGLSTDEVLDEIELTPEEVNALEDQIYALPADVADDEYLYLNALDHE